MGDSAELVVWPQGGADWRGLSPRGHWVVWTEGPGSDLGRLIRSPVRVALYNICFARLELCE